MLSYIQRMAFAVLLFAAYNSKVHAIPQFHAFKDVRHLPKQIRSASQAVIKLMDATASFVCHEGRVILMTNHHVLGSHNCSLNGCYASSRFQFEKGQPHQQKQLFLIPIAASEDVDVAFYSFKEVVPNGLTSFQPPCLKFPSQKLQGSQVTLLGHPRGSLKKFSQGKLIERWRGYIHISAFSLPGSSGSPMVDELGQLIGIHHSSVKKNDMFSASEIIYKGRGSSYKAISKVLREKRTPEFISTRGPVSFSFAKRHALVFQQARVVPKLIGGENFFSKLFSSCQREAGLKTLSLKKFASSHKACTVAKSWLQCPSENSLAQDSTTYTHCPKDRQKWHVLFLKVAKSYQRFQGQKGFSWALKAHSLGQNKQKSAFLAKSSQAWLDGASPLITPRLLLNTSLVTRETETELSDAAHDRLVSQLVNYQKIQGYHWHLGRIALTAFHLFLTRQLNITTLEEIFAHLLKEPKLTLNTLLMVEKLQHEAEYISQHQLKVAGSLLR